MPPASPLCAATLERNILSFKAQDDNLSHSIPNVQTRKQQVHTKKMVVAGTQLGQIFYEASEKKYL